MYLTKAGIGLLLLIIGLYLVWYSLPEFLKNFINKKNNVFVYKFNIFSNHNKNIRSRNISQKVKNRVWNRDNGKCVICNSNENLEFDHIIPFSKGGANTYRNIQLLCQACNRSKSNKIG
tara:strand:+ start:4485 stop:4841 length:357 start_codon:yes stop_codon:yes gene_type:complete